MGQERGIATLARLQADELVGDLPVQELDRARAGERELAALGAVDQAAALGQRRVLGPASGAVSVCCHGHRLRAICRR